MPGIDPIDRMERDALLARIVADLESDETVVAAWLAGSLGRGAGDDLSDIDLWIVVDDDCIDSIVATPDEFVHAIVPTVMEIHAPANAPAGGAYLLTWIAGRHGPQQVDWCWIPASRATRPGRTRLLFKRRTIPAELVSPRLSDAALTSAVAEAVKNALLMAFISAKHAQRGNDWTTPSQMTHLATCIGTVEWLLKHRSPPAFDDRARLPLPTTMPVTFDDQRGWIRASVRTLIVRLEAELPSVVAELEAAIDSLERWLKAGAIRNRSSSQAPPE